MKFPRKATCFTGLAAAALVVALSGSSPALARLDPGGPAGDSHQTIETRHCPLERIGTQLVRCDSLTGTGIEAPTWIPER